jgi:hypothetical protein
MSLATVSDGELPRQGGQKLFFDLIYLFFHQGKSDYAPAAMSRLTFVKHYPTYKSTSPPNDHKQKETPLSVSSYS